MSLATKLKEQRDALVTEVETTLATDEVSAEALDAASAKQEEIAALDERIATAEKVETRTAAIAESRKDAGVKTFGGAVVTKETMTYDKDGRNSFVRDMIGAHLRNDSTSWERLTRHSQEVAIETRDVNRTDGSGGDLVPPIYLVNEYAEFARAARVTADLLTNMALPAGTDSINIPQITTGTLAAFQSSDNSATTTRDLITSTVTAPVRTISGYENVSIQLVEQSPLAGGLDRLVFGDLMADYALQLNTAVVGSGDGTSGTLKGLVTLGTDTTNGIPVTWTETTPSAVNGAIAIAKAISKVVTNRYKAAEAIVMSPSVWYWFASQVDSQNRPLVVPVTGASQAFNAAGTVTNPGAPAGLVGTIQGVPVFIDATMTKTYGASTNQSPILVGKFSDSYLFETGLKTRVLPDVLSANLTIRFQVYGYAALAHRFNKAVSAVTGTGTVAPSGY
jgi:HK97 family phage major capsid protein